MSHVPSLDPESTSYGVILWVCSIILSVISQSVPMLGVPWYDVALSILAKLAPLISTFFLYIINKEVIDAYFIKLFTKAKAKAKARRRR